MEEKNMEKKIISEEDLEKAAGGAGITKEQLMRALPYLGIALAGVTVAGAGAASGAEAGGTTGAAVGAAIGAVAGAATGAVAVGTGKLLSNYVNKKIVENYQAKKAMELKEIDGH